MRKLKGNNKKIFIIGRSWGITINKEDAIRRGFKLGEKVDVEIKSIE